MGYTNNQGILSGDGESRYEPWGSSIQGVWFSSWYVISIDTEHIAQSAQSSLRWSPAFKMEPVLFPPSIWLLKELEEHGLNGVTLWLIIPPGTLLEGNQVLSTLRVVKTSIVLVKSGLGRFVNRCFLTTGSQLSSDSRILLMVPLISPPETAYFGWPKTLRVVE